MILRTTFILIPFLTFWLPKTYSEPKASLDTLEGLVSTLTTLQLEVATEKREWKEQKSFLEAERSLLQKEISSLETELATFREFSTSEEQERNQLLSQQQELTKQLNRWQPRISQMEKWISAYQKLIPEALFSEPFTSEEGRIVDRIQSIASALTRLESLHNDFHVTRELLPDEQGQNIEMEVLYFGLSQALAVSPTNDWAGVGSPSSEGWTWQTNKNWASAIRFALEVIEQKRGAELIELPLNGLSEKEQP